MMHTPSAQECREAADLLERLPDLVIEVSFARDLTPAEVAKETGVAVSTLMRFADDPPSFSTPVRLLRWLAEGER